MRKYLAALILLIIAFSASAQSSEFHLKVQIRGLNVGDTCYLGNYFGNKQFVQDTAIVDRRGYIEFKKNEALPGGIYFIVIPEKNYFEIILDKEQAFSLETSSDDLINSMKVQKSTDNELFYDYLKFVDQKHKQLTPLAEKFKELKEGDPLIEELRNEMQEINKTVEAYKLNFIEQHPDRFLSKVFLASKEIDIPEPPVLKDGSIDSMFTYYYYKNNYFNYIDFSDDRLLRTPIFHNKLNNYVTNLVIQMPDSLIKEADILISKTKGNKETFKYLVWFFTNFAERSNVMGMDAAFVYLVEKYYTKEKAHWLNEEQLQKITNRAKKLKPLLIGNKAPNINVMDSLGRRHSLHNVKAEYTVLYIWSTDCGHCKRMTPVLKDFYTSNKKRGVEVFALCTETDIDAWKKAVIDYNAPWINVWDPINMSNYRDLYDVYSTPIIYFLDKDKKIIAKRIDANQLSEIFDKLYSEKNK